MILSKKIIFSKHQNLSLNHRIQEPGWLWSPQMWFSRPKKPLQPHWPQQPWQPHWPHQPHQPYFLQEIPDLDGLIIPGTKMTNNSPFLWNRSSKIQFFTDIWYLFCWRLLRSGYVTFLKTGWWNSNDRTSEIHRCLYHYQKVVFRWPPRSSKYIKAIQKTLYYFGWYYFYQFTSVSQHRQTSNKVYHILILFLVPPKKTIRQNNDGIG
jgi:hypothetical protein